MQTKAPSNMKYLKPMVLFFQNESTHNDKILTILTLYIRQTSNSTKHIYLNSCVQKEAI